MSAESNWRSGRFPVDKMVGREAGLKVAETLDNVNESDDRCQYEPASNAAAAYYKKLMSKEFKDEPNRVTFAVASWNSGEGYLKTKLENGR